MGIILKGIGIIIGLVILFAILGSSQAVDTATLEQTAKTYLENKGYEIYSVKIGQDMVIEYGITQQQMDRMNEALDKPLGEGEAPFQALGDMIWDMIDTYAYAVEQMPELGNLRMRNTAKDGSITEFTCLKEDLNMESNSLMYKVITSGSKVQG